MNRSRSRRTAVAIAATLALFPLAGGKCTESAGPVLSTVLDSISLRVSELIQEAGNAADGVVFGGGVMITHAIDDVRVAYEDELDKTTDKLDDVSTKKIQELETIGNEWAARLDTATTTLATRFQAVANTLPGASKVPQVLSFSPHFAAATGPTVELEVTGNFPQVQDPGFGASLTAGSQTIPMDEGLTTGIKFVVPTALLSQPATDRITTTTWRLSVPYKKTLGKQRVGNFSLLVGTLPATPGTFTLVRTSTPDVTETQPYVGPWYTQDSNDGQTHRNVPYQFRPDDGWKVVPGTQRFVEGWHRGSENTSWSWQWDQIDPAAVTVSVTTLNMEWYDPWADGGVWFHVEFDETRTRPGPEVEERIPIDLTWGAQLVFPVQANHWRIEGTLFGGQPYQTAGPDPTRFFEVKVVGDTVTLRAYGPETVGMGES